MTSIDMPRPRPGPFRRFATAGLCRAEVIGLFRLGAPMAGLALVNMAMSVTDTFMTASFGPEALAAVAVASDAYSIVFYLAVGCIGGLAPLYAAAAAAGDDARLARLRGTGWTVAGLLALPLAVLVWVGPSIFPALGMDRALVETGAGYMRAMALALPVMLAVGVLRVRLTALERPGVMLRITLAAVPLNALFNSLFMHGAFGVAGLGVTGAGVSSLLVGCLILAALAFESRRLGDCGLCRPAVGEIAEVLRIGFPIGVATLAEVGVYLGATVYVATLSVPDAAAHAIAIRLAGVTYAVYFGLQQAATIRMARVGDNAEQKRRIAVSALALSLAAGACLFALVLGSAGPLSSKLLGGEAVSIAVILLAMLAVSDLFGPVGAAAAGLLRGVKVTRPVMTISLFGNWLIAAPLALILSEVAGLGAVGVWAGLTTGTVLTAMLTVRALRGRVSGGGSANTP